MADKIVDPARVAGTAVLVRHCGCGAWQAGRIWDRLPGEDLLKLLQAANCPIATRARQIAMGVYLRDLAQHESAEDARRARKAERLKRFRRMLPRQRLAALRAEAGQ